MASPTQESSQVATARQGADLSALRIAGSGFLMGAADIVPGVSGGTMALILGVYERLLAAISHCDRHFAGMLLERRWKAAAKRVDLHFVMPLGCGILVGAAGLATVMKRLLTDHRSLTYAAFAGLILASSILVARRISSWNSSIAACLVLGIVVAFRLVTLPALQRPPDTYWYLFLCGAVGITAMILPGISGAFILLLLRRYDVVLDSIRSILHGELSVTVVATVSVFALGCLTGLLCFSRVLRWLLANHHDTTMAVLCGFMIGSLNRLWPFQRDLTPDVVDIRHKQFENVVPSTLSAEVWLAILMFALSLSVILVLDALAARSRRP